MYWRLHFLGDIRIVRGESVYTRFESRRVVALLARLALAPARLHPREELAALLWPDADRAVGLERLRHVLSSLQRQLAPPGGAATDPLLLIDRHAVRLNRAAVSCDALEFEALARQGRDAEARALYAGDLLVGFYDDWIVDERERLRALRDGLGDEERAAPEPLPARRRTADLRVFLPGYLTAFFGRDAERAQLTAYLATSRLVTLHGPGGGGKTRLAVETARALAERFEIVAFVALAECVDPQRIAERVRVALQLPATELSPDEQIAGFLAGRTALLVLDNLEQLVGAGAGEAVAALLAQLPALHCLATSRRLLGVPGERALSLSPLPLPEAEARLSDVAASPSVALFVHRAQAARPDFQVVERNRAELTALCRALEGVPLALELAASRIRVLSVAEMRRQWNERFTWLVRTGAGIDKEGRQRSLTATLEWSWRLLSPAMQRFLAALTVFRGGWSVDAAAAVTRSADARERLEALTADALVTSEEMPDGQTRFSMLEMVRAFAAARLPESERRRLRAGHRAFFERHAAPADALNLVAALETAIEDEDPIAYALFVGQQDRWATWLDAPAALAAGRATLALPAPAARIRLLALARASSLADMGGDRPAARAFAEQAVAEAGDDPGLRALALSGRARVGVALHEPEPQILPGLEESLALARACGDRATEGANLRRLGILAMRRKDWDAAEAFLTASLTLFQEEELELDARYTLANLAQTAQGRGDDARALALYRTCLARSRAAGDRVTEGKNLHNIAAVQAACGAWDDALETGRECLRLTRAVGNLRTLAFALWNLPEPLLFLGRPEEAARLMAFVAAFWKRRFGALDRDDEEYLARIRAGAEERLGPARTAALWAEGEMLALPEALSLALA